MKTYIFVVPCSLEYEVFAEDEEQARNILEEGTYPNGEECARNDILCDKEDSKKADLVEIEER